MTFRQIAFGSDEFRQECALRNEVLRAPLGLNLFDEDLEPERTQWHFGLFGDAGELLACVIAVVHPPQRARIRQMAVRPAQQRRGCGRQLLRAVEEHLARHGIVEVSLHARTTAVDFYEKLGYVTVGAEFTEVGIPHLKMEKRLTVGQPDPSAAPR